jgi:hypothetical protein
VGAIPRDWEPLPWEDVAQRGGLILGACLFGAEAFGIPAARGDYLAQGLSLALAALVVAVIAFDWRMLGDWRDARRLWLNAGAVLAASLPLALLMAPSLQGSALPDGAEKRLVGILETLRSLPFVGVMFTIAGGLFTAFLALLMSLFVLASRERARGGIIGLAVLGCAGLALLRPSLESAMAVGFLAMFFVYQWEAAVVLPPGVRAALTEEQFRFLRILSREGVVSIGEARLHLRDDAAAFQQLIQLNLVAVDGFAREVTPGTRLAATGLARTLAVTLSWMRRLTWVALGLVYIAMPDLLPGPVDDLVVAAICSSVGFGVFDMLFAGRRKGFSPGGGSGPR